MFRKTLKRSVSILTLLAMMLTLFPFAAFADETTASDLDGHWAEEVMQEWIGYGIIAGYEDGTVRPDRSITRAEMTALLDRVMDYQTTAANHFTDLDDNWYTDVVLKANAAGMISGYPDGTVKPDATISRQEAVAMFARVLSLDTANAPEADFTDMDAVGDWAKDAVNAMAAKGYVNGDNGQFRPQSGITRAEVITIFNNIFDDLYAESGTYFGDVNGSAVISADDVTLENTAIGGDLIVAEGVGDGHVVLDNVTIDGKLIIRGGGENSVIIRGNSNIGTVTVERTDGAVRVAVEGGASVDTLFVNDGNDTVTVEGSIGTLNVATGAAEIVLNGDTDTLNVSSENAVVTISGTLGTVTVDEAASDATINIQSDASVSTLTTAATNTTVNVLGSVETVQVADTASDATIAVSENASVNSVTTAAQNTTVSGEGTVTSVEVGETASGATVTTPGTTVENNSNDDVTIGDGETIGAGETATTPGGTTEEPSEPSTPSEPSRPSHTHTYVDGVCTAGDAYDPTWAQVNSAETWNAAVAAGQNIVLTADFTADAQLQITTGITVNGNNHTITAGTWTDEHPDSKGDAHLVSVNAGANEVVIKNITLTGAQNIVNDGNKTDYASGMSVYESSNVTLNNVTLQNNAGAGLIVNGSTVNATALHTSGNEWGGVNVDKGTNVTDETTFTFDATSTFAETAKVYSDNGGVTVNAPEGWACVQVEGKSVWSNLFAGGDGTTDNPYLISNNEQYANIAYVATKNLSFKLTTDITLASTEGMLPQFIGTFDGDNHTITLPDKAASASDWCAFAELMTGTLKNLVINHGTDGVTPFIGYSYGDSMTFENVDICTPSSETVCLTSADDNNESAYMAHNQATSLTFKDCNNYLSYYYPGGANMYTSAFMGGYTTLENGSTITFNNCWNYGDLTMSHASLFIGNGNKMNNTTVTVTNSGNYGHILGYSSAKPFCAISTTSFEQNESNKTLNNNSYNKDGGSIETLGTLAGFSATYTDNKIVITAPTNAENVDHYNLTYSAYGRTEDGTFLFNVILPISKESLSTDYQKYTMISTDSAKSSSISLDDLQYSPTGSYDMKYAIKDNYMICDFGSYADGKPVTLNNTNPTITVTAVTTDGEVLGMVNVQEPKE